MSNQRWNNAVYVKVEIYNVEQRQINVVYFNVETMLFNVKFHKVDQRRNSVVNMTIFKKLKRVKKCFWALKKKITHLINNALIVIN